MYDFYFKPQKNKSNLLGFVLSLCVFSSAHQCFARAQAQNDLSNDIELLANADCFADGVSALSIPAKSKHQLFIAFMRIQNSEKPISLSVLRTHFGPAPYAGKLYLATLMKRTDPKLAQQKMKELVRNSSKIQYLSGCSLFKLPVSALAEQLSNEDSFKRFLTAEMLVPMKVYFQISNNEKTYLKVKSLSQAQSFEDLPTYPKIGGGVLHEQIGKIPIVTLKHFMSEATPAGKLYLAAILQRDYSIEGNRALKRLSNDSTKVQYKSGSTSKEVSVSQIAMELMKARKFETFQLQESNQTLD